ncbi:hypothetical protein ACPB8Q_05760 [Methanocaldococcus indicus]|uniref:hypothetical protein n=1 Tax=Methanocaldococcus indicus TaxID=213231 RepID=UPI003C6D5851
MKVEKIMKKVFEEELRELENELNKLFKKYNVKTIKELKYVANEEDYKRALELTEKIDKVISCLREVNVKAL